MILGQGSDPSKTGKHVKCFETWRKNMQFVPLTKFVAEVVKNVSTQGDNSSTNSSIKFNVRNFTRAFN